MPPDPDVPLDLQTVVQACFNFVGYERLLDYAGSPPLLDLEGDDAAWVVEILRVAGLRETVATHENSS